MSLRPSSPSRYRLLDKVGEGSFSQVFRALDKQEGALVAVKKVRVRDTKALPKHALREVLALQHLAHPNVLPLYDLYTHGSNLVLVLPLVPHSLASHLGARTAPLPEADARTFARMLLHGLAACHELRILHRDLKPSNLLLNAQGVLQLADFGQARLQPPPHEAADLSHDVATRWYRAPELLLGARRYGTGVDLWAAGCIIAQLLTLSPLLPGESDMDQLFQVIRLLGTPHQEEWPGLVQLPDYHKVELPELPPTPLPERLPHASAAALALLGEMLRYEPTTRLAAAAALSHPWVLDPCATPPSELVPPPAPRPASPPPEPLIRIALAPMPPERAAAPSAAASPDIQFPALHCTDAAGPTGSAAEAQQARRAQAMLRHLNGSLV